MDCRSGYSTSVYCSHLGTVKSLILHNTVAYRRSVSYTKMTPFNFAKTCSVNIKLGPVKSVTIERHSCLVDLKMVKAIFGKFVLNSEYLLVLRMKNAPKIEGEISSFESKMLFFCGILLLLMHRQI